jgi:hypothetical protein
MCDETLVILALPAGRSVERVGGEKGQVGGVDHRAPGGVHELDSGSLVLGRLEQLSVKFNDFDTPPGAGYPHQLGQADREDLAGQHPGPYE